MTASNKNIRISFKAEDSLIAWLSSQSDIGTAHGTAPPAET